MVVMVANIRQAEKSVVVEVCPVTVGLGDGGDAI